MHPVAEDAPIHSVVAPGVERWLSAHLFIGSGLFDRRADRVVLEVVAPFVRRCARRGWIDRFFFVRYNKGGEHIRVRLAGDREVLDRNVRPALARHVARMVRTASRASVQLEPGREGAPAPEHELISRLAWIDYEPEMARYGGATAVDVAEQVFHATSVATLDLLRHVQDREHRRARALWATLTLLHAFCESREAVRAICLRYAGTQRPTTDSPEDVVRAQRAVAFAQSFERLSGDLTPRVHVAWDQLADGLPLSPTLGAMSAELVRCRERLARLCERGDVQVHGRPISRWADCCVAVVPSYLHMLNNRLGIEPADEPYLAYLLGHALP